MALLEARGIVRRFGELEALSGVDFDVHQGVFHGLVGPNGSGKTTLMKCLAGAIFPNEGRIAFKAREITTTEAADRARLGLSIKFQITSVLAQLTVYDNVLIALQSRGSMADLVRSRTRGQLDDRIMDALQRFQLVDRAGELAGSLSHGEQQWLEITMALAGDPTLLLLDEPTAGMSLEERKLTGEMLRPIREHCAVVIVEHDLDFIRDICDVLTVLDQGAVVGTGTVEEIQRNPKVQEVYLSRV